MDAPDPSIDAADDDEPAEGDRPACAHHPESQVEWRCPTCETSLCEGCVRVFAGRDIRVAACKRCGGKCESLREDESQPEGLRAGAVEDEETRRRRRLQDEQIPLGVLIGSTLLLLLLLIGGRGAMGLALWPVTLAMAAGTMIAGFWASGLVTEADFDPLRPILLKLAATGAALHAARLLCWVALTPQFPSQPGAAGMAQGLAMLGPLSVIFVLAPVGVLISAVMGVFRLDLHDQAVTVVALFLVDAFGLFFLVALGLFG